MGRNVAGDDGGTCRCGLGNRDAEGLVTGQADEHIGAAIPPQKIIAGDWIEKPYSVSQAGYCDRTFQCRPERSLADDHLVVPLVEER
jgi:hypothetical protein